MCACICPLRLIRLCLYVMSPIATQWNSNRNYQMFEMETKCNGLKVVFSMLPENNCTIVHTICSIICWDQIFNLSSYVSKLCWFGIIKIEAAYLTITITFGTDSTEHTKEKIQKEEEEDTNYKQSTTCTDVVEPNSWWKNKNLKLN